MPELFSEWKFASLRNAAEKGKSAFIDGDWIEAPYITSSGIRLIQTGNVGRGHLIEKSSSQRYISNKTFLELNCSWVRSGDILICRLADPIGRACSLPDRLDKSVTSVDVTIMRVNEEEFYPHFVLHYLNSERNLKKAADVAGGSTRSRISRTNLGSLEIPSPPLPQQQKIAQILDTLDTQIQKTEALIAKLEKIKEGLLHDLLTRGIDQSGQLRPTPDQAPEFYKESALGLIPKRWEVRSIAESGVKLIDGDRGANYPSDEDFTTGSGYCIFLSAKNVTRSGFRFDTRQFISKDKDRILGTGKLVRNDVIVTTRGTVGNFAHYSYSVPYDNIRINSGMLILRGAESNLIPEFLYISLKEHLFHRENGKKGSGSAQPQLPARDFESFLLVIPDQEEQQKIIELASVQNQRIKAENDEIQKLTSLKSALMDDLLTGRVRVTPLLANS